MHLTYFCLRLRSKGLSVSFSSAGCIFSVGGEVSYPCKGRRYASTTVLTVFLNWLILNLPPGAILPLVSYLKQNFLWGIYVTSFSVFHTEATVTNGLKNRHRMVLTHASNFYLEHLGNQKRSLKIPDRS